MYLHISRQSIVLANKKLPSICLPGNKFTSEAETNTTMKTMFVFAVLKNISLAWWQPPLQWEETHNHQPRSVQTFLMHPGERKPA